MSIDKHLSDQDWNRELPDQFEHDDSGGYHFPCSMCIYRDELLVDTPCNNCKYFVR